ELQDRRGSDPLPRPSLRRNQHTALASRLAAAEDGRVRRTSHQVPLIVALPRFLAHPLTRELALDDPRTTDLRRRIIADKRFLRRLYREWYATLARRLPPGEGAVVEVGSGGGFLHEAIPEAIASEVFFLPHVDVVLNAMALPFAAGSLKALLMV